MRTTKYFLLVFICLINQADSKAQNNRSEAVKKIKELQSILQMNSTQYAQFKTILSHFTDSITDVLKNKNIPQQDKRFRIDVIQANRQLYLQQALSGTQYQAYKEYEKSIADLSSHKKSMEKQEKKFKEKGMKVESKTSRTL
jgi:hypothetical protein